MSFNVYYNKQAPRNPTENPPTNLGFTQAPQTNMDISKKQVAGLLFAAQRIVPAGKQVIQTVVKATGDERIERAVSGINRAITFGGTAWAINVPAAIGIEAVSVVVDGITNYIQELSDQENQRYEIQKKGVAINKFVGVGERLD